MQSVASSAGGGVVERNLQIVVAEAPVEGGPRIFSPTALSRGAISLQARRNGGAGFDGLLVEAPFLRFLGVAAVRADWDEVALHLAALNLGQPIQCFKTGRYHCLVGIARSGSYQRLRQAGIRIGKYAFKPLPVWRRVCAVRLEQTIGKRV